MLEALTRDSFSFMDLTEEEKKKRGILGRLYGPCADLIHDTRNGRKYSQKLWEKVFNDDLTKEAFANGGIPGELDHPEDRSEICSEKIAIMMPEAPKKDKNGTLVAYFDILDTPCGRIAYQLAKYGYKWGISSRGEGDIIEDYNGEESVDPDTYSFKCFDVVLCPSVKAARMNMVESLKPGLKEALTESLNKATQAERAVMKETLTKLNIGYKEEKSKTKGTQPLNEEKTAPEAAAADSGVIRELQENIKKVAQLRSANQELQEKLSAGDARETKLKEELQRCKDTIIALSNTAKERKAFKQQAEALQEQLKDCQGHLEKKKSYIESLRSLITKVTSERDALRESLDEETGRRKALTENLNSSRTKSSAEIRKLTEQLEGTKTDLSIKIKECDRKVQEAKTLVEKYRRIANNVVNRYVESKALALGISKEEVVSRLPKEYSLSDVDRICESLKRYQLNRLALPTELTSGASTTRVAVKESKEPIRLADGVDDEVDEALLRLVNKN